MKYFLFVCLLSALPSAFARTSTADCARVLSDQVWAQPDFNKWSRLNGDLDGGGEITLLVRVPRVGHVLALPAYSGLTNPRALSFSDEKNTYHVLQGKVVDLRKHKAFISEMNAGGKLRYQVLDRTTEWYTDKKLGTELARRLPFLNTVAKPFGAIDQWLARHPMYQRARSWVNAKTYKLRTAVATRLHRGRNPVTPVQPYVKWEVQTYLEQKDAPSPWGAREAMILKRLTSFFNEHAPETVPVEGGRSLTALTFLMLNLLRPEDYRANSARAVNANLGEYNYDRLTRDKRMVIMQRAWGLIDAATWKDSSRKVGFNMFEIDRTIAEFERVIAEERTLLPKRFSLKAWTSGEGTAELLDARHARLQTQRPLTVIKGPGDLRWVLVQANYARSLPASKLIAKVIVAGERNLSPAVQSQIERGLKDDGETLPQFDSVTGPLSSATLVKVAMEQKVFGLRTVESERSRVFVIPLGVDPEVVSARDVEGDDVAPEPLRGLLSVALARQMRNAVEIDGVYELMLRDWTEADVKTKLIRFTYEPREGNRPLVTVQRVSEVNRRKAVAQWQRLAAQRGVETIDFAVEGDPKFTFKGVGLKRIQFQDWAVVESNLQHGLPDDQDEIIALFSSGAPVTVDEDSRCADVVRGDQTFEVCFGNVLGSFAKVKSVRPKAATLH